MFRNRNNYFLFTEREANLGDLLTAPISGVYVGVRERKNVDSDYLLATPRYRDDKSMFSGGPLFIYLSQLGIAWALESDSYLGSLVVRKVPLSPVEEGFLDSFYEQDSYVPSYLRATKIVEVTKEFGVGEKQVVSAKVFKLPDNTYSFDRDLARKAGVFSPNQCAVELEFESGHLLIGNRMSKSGKGHCFMSWGEVSNDFPTSELELCLCCQKCG
jgi:hypothetical protein